MSTIRIKVMGWGRGGVTVDYLVTVRGEREGNIHPLFRTCDTFGD